jgi:hypothetical protein
MDTDTWVRPPAIYSARINGACVCGAVRWSYDRAATSMLHCHCSICRKHHGSLYATVVAGPLTTFHWRAGTERIGTWQSSQKGRRSFCSTCGSKVPGVNHEASQVWMPAGALEGEFGIRPQMHLFVGSKAASHEIHDGLPQHQAYPPGWGASAVETPRRDSRAGVTSGSCACGHICFELDSRPLRLHHCHCERCRRARGAAHATNVIYGLEALRYTRGESQLVDFALPGAEFFGTAFCGLCGGVMPRRSAARGVVVVPIGALDEDPGIHAVAHQFVRSKAPWHEIHDGVPQYPQAAPRTAPA